MNAYLKKLTEKLPFVLCLLLAVSLCIKGLREPDIWWQIRTGEWIMKHRQVPTVDVFSYTHKGAPWVNVKWGSEVLFSAIANTLGPECIFLLQAIIAVGILWVLYQICKIFTGVNTEHLPLVFALCSLPLLALIEYRFNGRPEMFSHLFAVIFLYVLLSENNLTSGKIWMLIPLQILWANLHEAFGMGMVLTGIFALGNTLDWLVRKRNHKQTATPFPKMWYMVLVAQVLSTAINPYGFALLTKPLNILGQVYENKFTTELFDFRRTEFWQWNVYLLTGLVAMVTFYFVWQKRVLTKSKKKTSYHLPFGTSYYFALIAFIYLGSTAYRNVIFTALVFFPALVLAACRFLHPYISQSKNVKRLSVAVSITLASAYLLVVSGKYYKLTNSRDSFGLQVLEHYNPIQTAEAIKQNGLTGKCFSDYLTSSYLLWALQPGFETFIDLRDLDVFPSDFFSRFAEIVTFPQEFERLDSVEQFSYIVLYRPQFNNLHKHLYNHSRFKMLHVDDVAVVYSPDTTKAAKTVTWHNKAGIGEALNKIFNPFYNKPHVDDNSAVVSSYYIAVGDYANAERYAKTALNNQDADKGYQLLGEINYQTQQYVRADSFYRIALQINHKNAAAWLGLGATCFQQQNFQQALQHFEQAITYDKLSLNARLFAAECCKHYVSLNNAESLKYLNRAIEHYLAANRLNPDNPGILLNTGLLYFKKNDCKDAVKFLLPIRNFEGLSAAEKKTVSEILAKCGA